MAKLMIHDVRTELRISTIRNRVTITNLDSAKIAARCASERRLLEKAVDHFNSYFPPAEQIPQEVWKNAITRPIGGNPKNRYQLTLAMIGEEIVGASSYFYLAGPSTLFCGYIRVVDEYQNSGIGTLLFSEMVAFATCAAEIAGKSLLSISGEVERLDSVSSEQLADARKRLAIFITAGAGLLGHHTDFYYGQPLSGEKLTPLNIIFAPFESKAQLSADEVGVLVTAIYSAIYNSLPDYQVALLRVLRSIPKTGVPIATDFGLDINRI